MALEAEILCKYKGTFRLAIFTVHGEDRTIGPCPLCGGREYSLRQGWEECQGCLEFAVSEVALDKIFGKKETSS